MERSKWFGCGADGIAGCFSVAGGDDLLHSMATVRVQFPSIGLHHQIFPPTRRAGRLSRSYLLPPPIKITAHHSWGFHQRMFGQLNSQSLQYRLFHHQPSVLARLL